MEQCYCVISSGTCGTFWLRQGHTMGLWDRTVIYGCSWHFQLLEHNYRIQPINSEIRQLVLSQIPPNSSLFYRENI